MNNDWHPHKVKSKETVNTDARFYGGYLFECLSSGETVHVSSLVLSKSSQYSPAPKDFKDLYWYQINDQGYKSMKQCRPWTRILSIVSLQWFFLAEGKNLTFCRLSGFMSDEMFFNLQPAALHGFLSPWIYTFNLHSVDFWIEVFCPDSQDFQLQPAQTYWRQVNGFHL